MALAPKTGGVYLSSVSDLDESVEDFDENLAGVTVLATGPFPRGAALGVRGGHGEN